MTQEAQQSMMADFIHVKRYKRGALWDDGSPRMCTRCGTERTRRRQAVLTAIWRNGKYKLPVAYCDDHIPEELQ